MTENYMVAGLHLTNAMEKNPQKIAEIMNKIFDLILTKSIEPRIDSIFDFKQAVEAMQRLAHRKNIGKVILKIRNDV